MKPMHWALHCGAISLASSSAAIAAYAMQMPPELLAVGAICMAAAFSAMALATGEQDDRS